MTAHMPGPWTLVEYKGQTFGVHSGEICLADVRGHAGNQTVKANAHLIAAAPDLLAVVRHIPWELFGTGHPLLGLAQAALAKAEAS